MNNKNIIGLALVASIFHWLIAGFLFIHQIKLDDKYLNPDTPLTALDRASMMLLNAIVLFCPFQNPFFNILCNGVFFGSITGVALYGIFQVNKTSKNANKSVSR